MLEGQLLQYEERLSVRRLSSLLKELHIFICLGLLFGIQNEVKKIIKTFTDFESSRTRPLLYGVKEDAKLLYY